MRNTVSKCPNQHILQQYINYMYNKLLIKITNFYQILCARNTADLLMTIRAIYLIGISFIRTHCVLLECMN